MLIIQLSLYATLVIIIILSGLFISMKNIFRFCSCLIHTSLPNLAEIGLYHIATIKLFLSQKFYCDNHTIKSTPTHTPSLKAPRSVAQIFLTTFRVFGRP